MDVDTVTGRVGSSALGRTLMHEHLVFGYDGWQYDAERPVDWSAIADRATEWLMELRTFGVQTFVDPCPIELGRNVEMMAEVSRRSGIQIVCTTGFYFEGHGLPPYWAGRSPIQIAALYVRELTTGVGSSGIVAGAIKCGTGAPNVTALETRFLEATCIAQKETGAPVITHTQDGVNGPEQAEFFRSHGVPLHRCLIGHSCGNADHAYHRRIVDTGAYIGFDRIGIVRRQKDEVRADRIVDLFRSGHGAQIMLSQDRYAAQLGNNLPLWGTPDDVQNQMFEEEKRGTWPPRYSALFTDFLPMLKQRGLSDADISLMLDENPRRFFAGEVVPAPRPRTDLG